MHFVLLGAIPTYCYGSDTSPRLMPPYASPFVCPSSTSRRDIHPSSYDRLPVHSFRRPLHPRSSSNMPLLTRPPAVHCRLFPGCLSGHGYTALRFRSPTSYILLFCPSTTTPSGTLSNRLQVRKLHSPKPRYLSRFPPVRIQPLSSHRHGVSRYRRPGHRWRPYHQVRILPRRLPFQHDIDREA